MAHKGRHTHEAAAPARSEGEPRDSRLQQAQAFFELFARLIARWPTTLQHELIAQAAVEQRQAQREHGAAIMDEVETRRARLLSLLHDRLPSLTLDWADDGLLLKDDQPLQLTSGLGTPVLVDVTNTTDQPLALRAVWQRSGLVDSASLPRHWPIPPGSTQTLLAEIEWPANDDGPEELTLVLETFGDEAVREIAVPVTVERPVTLRGTLLVADGGTMCAGRVHVAGSDSIYRHGGEFASNKTLTEKPILFPPVGLWKKVSFFYCDGSFEMQVPPGECTVTFERGFEHARQTRTLTLKPGEVRDVELVCERLIDMPALGWISGDTHVHWVTNQWNVDEPLDLLAMVQRAEDLRVANNLTLLQRYANQAFIKPSQAAMGPVPEFSDSEFHIEMGEEYRNENLYGHLCFLNLVWLVQPIGTGSIIAGPDALDYPLNRTAIDACREQGGISIEAHGLGGNKDVPVNVIHNLSDSLDQIEPEMYYRLLDCGFRLPLSNGSDHPARTLGIARVYVDVDGEYSYERWIEGLRRGRTFTTSGPLIFLTVNEARIGDVVDASAADRLRVTARVVSRDPIGRFQIVSNHELLADREVTETSAEITVEIPAGQSRWIVARCSNRDDEDFGSPFSRFNAIKGPGIAHTSPVYVHVDGMPVFDAAAAAFWADRMRLHAAEIHTKGRFANNRQRDEAVRYVEEGVEMFEALGSQVQSARRRDESFEQMRNRLLNIVRRFGASPEAISALTAIEDASRTSELRVAAAPLTLATVSINPESRVKISADLDPVSVQAGRPQQFLIAVDNMAGVTAPLAIRAIDLANDPPSPADWCDVRLIDSPFVSSILNGNPDEYKVLEITVREAGQRELRLTADAGQGTQDLGFRATTDVTIRASRAGAGPEDNR